MGMSDLNERLNQLEQGALNFLFPRRCPFCNPHIGNKELICAGCETTLPYTGDRAGADGGVVILKFHDLSPATDEMRRIYTCECASLHEVRRKLECGEL